MADEHVQTATMAGRTVWQPFFEKISCLSIVHELYDLFARLRPFAALSFFSARA